MSNKTSVLRHECWFSFSLNPSASIFSNFSWTFHPKIFVKHRDHSQQHISKPIVSTKSASSHFLTLLSPRWLIALQIVRFFSSIETFKYPLLLAMFDCCHLSRTLTFFQHRYSRVFFFSLHFLKNNALQIKQLVDVRRRWRKKYWNIEFICFRSKEE